MKKTLIFAAAIVSAAFTANAADLVDSWTPNGGAWTAAEQPGFANGSGTILADAGSTGGAVLTATGGYGNSLFEGAFFYTLFTTPSFNFSVDSTSAGLTSIVLVMKAADQQAPVLTYSDGSAFAGTVDLEVGETVMVPSPIGDQAATVYTYTWDVTGYDFSNGFDIDFTAGIHNAFFEFELTQVYAVPEPSTYALILGGVILGGVAIARRRRA